MYRRRLERFPKILTPSEFAKKILEERKGEVIYDPKGLKVIVRPDGTKEVIRLSEVEREAYNRGFVDGLLFVFFLGLLAKAVLDFLGVTCRRC